MVGEWKLCHKQVKMCQGPKDLVYQYRWTILCGLMFVRLTDWWPGACVVLYQKMWTCECSNKLEKEAKLVVYLL